MEPSELAPRVVLGTWPTPVWRLEHASRTLDAEVWVKSEEACGVWGGNKVRKLEYILARLEGTGTRTLITYGAGTSSWAAAVALHGSERGFDCVLGLGGPIPDALQSLYARTGTHVHSFDHYTLTPAAAVRARVEAGLTKVARLPAGGSGLPGDLGSMNAGIEIARQVEQGALPPPKQIYVPAGTSGTAAGIASGVKYGGLPTEVVAVRVTPRPLGTAPVVRQHVARLGRFLKRRGVTMPSSAAVHVDGTGKFFAPAYGVGNPASEAAIEVAAADGLVLDPIYAAKAFAALIDSAQRGNRGPLLFVHTSPGPLPEVA